MSVHIEGNTKVSETGAYLSWAEILLELLELPILLSSLRAQSVHEACDTRP